MAPDAPKSVFRKILKITLWIGIVILLLLGGIFSYGYFRYGTMIKTLIEERVSRESKGLYHATIGNLYLNILSGNLRIGELKLTPDTAVYKKRLMTDTLSPLLFSISVDQFRVEDFNILKAIREREVDLKAIRIRNPAITIFRMQPSKKAQEDTASRKTLSIPLPKGLRAIAVGEVELENGSVDFYDLSGDSVIHQSIPACSIMITNILVDSAHQGNRRLFNADDIRIKINGIALKTKNGLNEISLDEIGLSTGKKSLYVKGFHLKPLFDRAEYMKKVGFQTDRMEIGIGKIDIRRIDFRELIMGGKIMAGVVEIDSLMFDGYRDKRIPRKPGFKPGMPQDGIRNLKSYLKIDTVLLKGGKATYSEQVNEVPGSLYFDKLEAIFTGLTNDSMLLRAGLVSELKGTAYLMGKGRLDATIRFIFGDTHNSFTFSGRVGQIDLREINPMLTKLLPAEVKSGTIKQLVIPLVTANDDVAQGSLLFYYNNLSIAMTVKEESTWNTIKKGVITWVANDLVVNNDNPNKSGKMRTGTIHFVRAKEKGIINFLWKSVLSGLKSTMGFNSKAQKEIIKSEKDEEKSRQKVEKAKQKELKKKEKEEKKK